MIASHSVETFKYSIHAFQRSARSRENYIEYFLQHRLVERLEDADRAQTSDASHFRHVSIGNLEVRLLFFERIQR